MAPPSAKKCSEEVARAAISLLDREPFFAHVLAGLGRVIGDAVTPTAAVGLSSARPVLYRRIDDDPRTLDPSVSYTVTEAGIIDLIYPSFFQYHYLKREPFVLQLALGAEEPKREPYPVTVTVGGKPVARQGEVHLLLIEPTGTPNTGDPRTAAPRRLA